MFHVSVCSLHFLPRFSRFSPLNSPLLFISYPQRQRLIRARVSPEEGGASGEDGLGANGQWGRENGTLAEGEGLPLEGGREMRKEMGGETGVVAQHKEEEEEEDQEEGAEENAPFNPFVLPGE